MLTISASILAANHANLADDVKKAAAAGVDSIHIDIMDGHYVDNLTFGPKTVEDLRKVTPLTIDVHFEMYRQEHFVDRFINAGADIITIQFESCPHPFRLIEHIKSRGSQVSIAFAPATPLEQIKPFVHLVDEVNIMTVEPGFGGQSFRKEVLPKIRDCYSIIQNEKLPTIISVDGGLNETTIPDVIKNGSQKLVIGTLLFESSHMQNTIQKIKEVKNEIQ